MAYNPERKQQGAMYTRFISGFRVTCKSNLKKLNPLHLRPYSSYFSAINCQCLLFWISKIKVECCKDCILRGVPHQHARFYRKSLQRLWTCKCGLRGVQLKSPAPEVAEGWRLTIINRRLLHSHLKAVSSPQLHQLLNQKQFWQSAACEAKGKRLAKIQLTGFCIYPQFNHM